jgi:formylglycine-generating enzyme required for sulfatase activity
LTNGFSLPVITSERGGLGTWSAMVMGNQEYASTGVLLPNQAERQDRLNAFLGDRKLDEQQTLSNDSSAMEQLWQAFRQVASPQAQRLLMVMAAAPVLTLPVMALLKEAKIPESTTPLPIAEILVSSLVLRKPGQEGISDPDQLQFELQPQMAELLVGRLSVGDRLDVLHSVTALVEKRWNRLDTGTSFEAVLCDPSVAPPVGMEGVVQFASVTARLLETLPGEQARRFAERLRRGAGLASPETWPKQHFTFKDLPYETAKLLPIPAPDLISFSTARYQEIELLPISFETAKLTITSKPEDRTKKKSNQKPVIEIHRSIGSAQAFYEPLQRKNLPPGAIAEATDPLTLTLVEIPKGEFPMGSPPEEPERYDDEGPQHLVKLESFFMAQTPITQAQWREVAGWQPWDGESWGRELKPNPSHFRGGDNQKGGKARLFDGEANTDQRPVEQVNWEDAIEFCNRLSQRTGRHYSLPSEAQWEYACRAGSITPFHFGETLSSELANFGGTEVYAGGLKGDWRRQTTPVGKSLASVTSADAFPANDWGLQDMHGNVWEWCLDQWHPSYEGAPLDGSAWVDADANQANIKKDEESNDRLLRGGSWFDHPGDCRSAYRSHRRPGEVISDVGLRVVCLPQGCSS